MKGVFALATKLIDRQRAVCRDYGAECLPPLVGSKVGIAANVRENVLPINGLRHVPEEGTNGWYIWAGQELSEDPDFFLPLHVELVHDWSPAILDYLALPPGWRFLVAGDYTDVWFDPELLKV